MSSTLAPSVRLIVSGFALSDLERELPAAARSRRLLWVGEAPPDKVVTPDDHAAATVAGGSIKAVRLFGRVPGRWLDLGGGRAVLPTSDPLAAVAEPLQGLLVDDRLETDLLSSWWFCRLTFPGIVPAPAAAQAIAEAARLRVTDVVNHDTPDSRWLLAGPHSDILINTARATLAHRHRVSLVAIPFLKAPFDSARRASLRAS